MSSASAGDIRQARRARVRMIRRRLVAGALALFVATWLLIAVTLVTGHDPALARKIAAAPRTGSTTNAVLPAAAKAPVTKSSTAAQTTAAQTTTAQTSTTSSGATSTSSAAGSAPAAASPVTSGQS